MSIIHIGRGFGFLVLVFFFGCLWETQDLVNAKFGPRYAYNHLWVAGVAMLCAAPMCLIAGRFFYDRGSELATDPITQKEIVIRSHTYLHIPLLWWGAILGAIGLCLVVFDSGELVRTVFAPAKTTSPKTSSEPVAAMHQPPAALATTGSSEAKPNNRSGDAPPADRLEPTNVTQQGSDTHANLLVPKGWIDDERRIPVRLPGSRDVQIQLTHEMRDGVQLRLKGKSQDGKGDLYLRLQILQ